MAHIRLIPTFSNKAARTGVCYISGRPPQKAQDGTREPVLDLDTWIDQEGNLEVSLDTAREIASVIGWVSAEIAAGYQAEMSALLGEVALLTKQLDEQKEATSVLAREVAGAAQEAVKAKQGAK